MKPDRELTEEEFALVRDNVALAKFLYQRYLSQFQKKADFGVDPDDLLSQAYYGLIRAAMRYRAYGEEKGYSEESIASGQYFGVFARKSIIGQMLDSLRKMDHVHTLVRKDYKLLVEKGLGSAKSKKDLAEAADLPVERVHKVLALVNSRPVNLEETAASKQGENPTTIGDTIAASGSVEASALETSLREAWVGAWRNLDDLPKVIIALKYYIGMELPEISETLGQSLPNIRKTHTEALLDIHGALVSRVLGA